MALLVVVVYLVAVVEPRLEALEVKGKLELIITFASVFLTFISISYSPSPSLPSLHVTVPFSVLMRFWMAHQGRIEVSA